MMGGEKKTKTISQCQIEKDPISDSLKLFVAEALVEFSGILFIFGIADSYSIFFITYAVADIPPIG